MLRFRRQNHTYGILSNPIFSIIIVAILMLLEHTGCSNPTTRDTMEGQSGTIQKPDNAKTVVQTEGELTASQLEMIQQLEAIGYLDGVNPAPQQTGVTVHNKELTCAGPTLYVSGHGYACIIDMEGKRLHSWDYKLTDVWPERKIANSVDDNRLWRYAHLFENGDLLAIFEGFGLIKIDKDSNLIWAYPGLAHHDLDVTSNGDIYVLTRKAHLVPRIKPEEPILEDFITILDRNGREKRSFSLLEAVERSPFKAKLLERIPDYLDIFHTNTIECLDGSFEHLSPIFKRGNILTSFKLLDAIAIIDPIAEKVVWEMTGTWARQHKPTLLKNGNILLFDNNPPIAHSSVLEIMPLTAKVVWQYKGSPPSTFFTGSCGAAQSLNNGNILITESEDGRIFEITQDKTIVWEYINPARATGNTEFISSIYEAVRLRPDFPLIWATSTK